MKDLSTSYRVVHIKSVYIIISTLKLILEYLNQYTPYSNMVSKTNTKITKVGSRHTIYLEKSFVEDSAFPFKPNGELLVRIEGNRIIIEKSKKNGVKK